MILNNDIEDTEISSFAKYLTTILGNIGHYTQRTTRTQVF